MMNFLAAYTRKNHKNYGTSKNVMEKNINTLGEAFNMNRLALIRYNINTFLTIENNILPRGSVRWISRKRNSRTEQEQRDKIVRA